MRDAFRLQRMQSGLKIQYECIKAFSETDLTQDLKKFDVPTLIIHSDDDQIVPIVAAYNSSKLFETATLKVYEGGPHGLANTHKGTGSTPTCWTSSDSEMQPTPPGRDIDVRRTP